MENTAKIWIKGCAAVVESTVSLEDWKLVEKYNPDALRILNENGEETFRVRTDEGPGSIVEDCVTWSEVTDEDGKATITVVIEPSVEDKPGKVKEVMGQAMLNLIGIEQMIPDLMEGIRQKEKQLDEHIIIRA